MAYVFLATREMEGGKREIKKVSSSPNFTIGLARSVETFKMLARR